MEDYLNKFIEWTKLKIRIHIADEREVFFREKEIWWASLGVNIGYEQDGKNKNFERPVIIVKKFNKDLFWAIPTTTKIKDKHYYFKFSYNGSKQSTILSQLKLFSSKRLIRKIGLIEDNYFLDIKDRLKNYL
ncbi:MAG: type II toxin-antitoxin system PemK/MazF family toxin [Candidatus Komeilibacteria bacterium]